MKRVWISVTKIPLLAVFLTAFIFSFFSNSLSSATTLLPKQPQHDTAKPVTIAPLNIFDISAPNITTLIDYSALDFILRSIVIDFGPSDRVMIRSKPSTGTNIKVGHSGAAALEGNRIYFSKFSSATRKALTQYRKDLEALGTRIDFALLTRNQQLAYWYNLHNVTVIEQIARHYPVTIPENINPDVNGKKLHDAKILNVKGIPLSLRDIRTKIVYAHWRDPLVIYGFFHGSVGGPSILPQAYTGENVQELLTLNAKEFVNSLRGVRKFGNRVNVSRVYKEASALFTNWQSDLRRHLLAYADTVVVEQLDNDYPLAVREKFTMVADLMGGYVTGAGRARTVIKNGNFVDERGLPAHVQKLLQDLSKKQRRLQRRNKNRFKQKIVIVGEDRDANEEQASD